MDLDQLARVFGTPFVSTGDYPLSDLDIYLVRTKTTITNLDELMDLGWVIISSWIEDESISKSWDNIITDVSFREVVVNLDADDPGASPEIITNMRQSIQKLRAVSISGYSPLAPRGLGMTTVKEVPKLSIMGLDIEEFKDKCYCLYAFGVCREIKWPDGRNAWVAKVSGNEEAVRETYKIINMLCPDFVNVHNGFNFDLRCLAASSALDPMIGPTFSERRLGNVGLGIFWRLDNGTMIVDSMYTAGTEPTSNWPSLSLAKMSERFDLPPKMDSGTMSIKVSDTVDVTDIVEYNARDADLHVWLPKNMLMCERLCTLAGVARSTMWDAIANNTAVMMFCLQQSEALKRGMILDLGRNTSVTDDAKYEGGFVVTPAPGCYEGVAMLDGNSLYGSVMKHLQIYVDRCVSAPTIEALRKKTAVHLPENVDEVETEKVVWNKEVIVMRTKRTYISVLQGEETLLGEMIGMLIQMRTSAKKEASRYPTDTIEWRRWTVLGQCYKLLLVSVYGATGGKHSILSSRVCAEAITCAARYYVKNMISVSESSGCTVVYGDTDSIFPWVGGKTRDECDVAGMRLKELVDKSLIGTPFENVKADMKGNYKHMLITTRKKYSTVDWDGLVETKGMTPVKRDTLPIAKYVTKNVLAMINNTNPFETKKRNVTEFLGKVMTTINSDKLPANLQMLETKINCQPHYKYLIAAGTALIAAGTALAVAERMFFDIFADCTGII
ncbi:DNA polymerase family B domain-containing protein [Hirsutella rhossiliensis]|uniref:DNA-directed DNA polymerase n=1 Tax=Hirsutella rhossiliensis TaxID=111463 RepID=A0A9P8MR27_9HYPO|nr:DNA polymerase family B domain-containing protein [Hirsutella rhossiliensis]KAH0957672.1 DNA polymerase family B domain-containing protein [Hirsutella rhossiliensis]